MVAIPMAPQDFSRRSSHGPKGTLDFEFFPRLYLFGHPVVAAPQRVGKRWTSIGHRDGYVATRAPER